MTKDEVKDVLVRRVTEKQGCKATELVADMQVQEAAFSGLEHDVHDLSGLIEDLVIEHRLIEIEYVLPQIGYRLKSFLLPIDTTFGQFRNLPQGIKVRS